MMQGQYPTSNSNSSFDADISDESQLFERIDASNGSNLSQTIEDESNEDETEMQKKLNDAQPVEIKCSEMMPKTPTNIVQPKEVPIIAPIAQPNEMINKNMNAVATANDANRNSVGQNFNDVRMNVTSNEQAPNKMQSAMVEDVGAANNYKNTNNFVSHQPYYNYNSNGNAQSQSQTQPQSQPQAQPMHQNSQMQTQPNAQIQTQGQTNYHHQPNQNHNQNQVTQPRQPEKQAIQPNVHQPQMQTQHQYHASIQPTHNPYSQQMVSIGDRVPLEPMKWKQFHENPFY